jgi:hypothetical protein
VIPRLVPHRFSIVLGRYARSRPTVTARWPNLPR